MVKAKAFYQTFKAKLKEDEGDTLERYWNAKSWTERLVKTSITILEKDFQLKTNKEYFRIDLIGWSGNPAWEKEGGEHISSKSCKKGSAPMLNEHYWNLEVALEFENDPLDWSDEVIKLCHIKCGLKVVIGYVSYEQREIECEMAKLDIVANHMRALNYGKLGEEEQFLIILGNCGKKEYTCFDADIEFKAYIFNGDRFEFLDG